ncbi:MFS transporter [Streptacidiphilus pinicola]|uniref:MFS transporter n=1 Tax=Streptacidiphilus pinicola TaxID=2219663 RepID=A0A2X0K2X1_9ACTN|nr:MFS transporter [Streptacidiphilus pinicola]RAG81909.1 MFS transporter [Streptacidiphilus pinicola]
MSPAVTARRRLILATSCLSMFITALDNSIVNLALPAIHQDLNASVSSLQWIADAYTMVLATLLLTAGATADRWGRRRVFLTGLAVFTVASLLCGLAPSGGWLIAFRALQAVGGAMLNPIAMSIISTTFPEPALRARAFGVWSSVYGASMAAGPLVGGVLVGTVGWRSIFWVNVPVGVLAIVLTLVFIPESRAERARRLDPVGQLLVMVFLLPLTYAVIQATGVGWTSPQILVCLGVSAVALIALLGYETRRTEPLVDLRFFRSIPFSGATLTAVAAFVALGGFLFLSNLYLQEARGFSALRSSLYLLPMAAMTLLLAPVSGRIAGARGARIPLLLAGVAVMLSGLMLTALGRDTPDWWVLVAFALFGVGFAMVNAPITSTAVSGMPRAQAGVASAIASTSRFVGQELGVAIIGSVLAAGLHGQVTGEFDAASHAGWWIVVGCGAVIAVLAVTTTSAWAKDTAKRVADRLDPAALVAPGPGVAPRSTTDTAVAPRTAN